MATGQLGGAIRYLRRILQAEDADGLSDAELVMRFVQDRDEAAFEALVRRHGPMVLGVCRRVLHDPHDAEDAFQATFLVFVRKAATLAQPKLLGNWLYGVAARTAREARNRAARRRAQERQVMNQPRPEPPEPVWSDLRPILDEELSRLPDKYRMPVVLCDLENKSRHEVALQIGCPEGTLSSRLARAREMLRGRLERRGLALGAGSLALLLSQNTAPAAVPASLVTATVQAVAAGAFPGPVVALTEGVLRAMFMTKLKITLTVLLAVGVAGTGIGVLAHRALADKPAADKPKEAAPAGEKPGKPAKGDKQEDGLQVQGTVKAVDLGKNTITLLVAEKGRKGGTEQTFRLTAAAKVFLPNNKKDGPKEGKLADLHEGANVVVTLSADKTAVASVQIQPSNVNGVIKSVDAGKNTVTVSLGGKKTEEEQTYTLAPDARIALPSANKGEAAPEGKLADLTPGTVVSLQLSVDRKSATAVAVHLPQRSGSVKAVDSTNHTITILTGGRKGGGDEETFKLANDVRIILPGEKRKEPKEGKLTDLTAGSAVTLTLSLDRKTVTSISIQAPSVSGSIKSVDAGKSTITVEVPAAGAGKGEKQVEDKTYELAKDVVIAVPGANKGEEGKLADLNPGLSVLLTLSLDQKTVRHIVVFAPKVSGSVRAVDPGNSTITITLDSKADAGTDQTIPVAREALITLLTATNVQAGKLADLLPGSLVSVELTLDKQTAESIQATGPNHAGSVTALDVGNKTITIAFREGKELVGGKTFELAKDLDLGDVTTGAEVTLRMAVGDKTVIGISVHKDQ